MKSAVIRKTGTFNRILDGLNGDLLPQWLQPATELEEFRQRYQPHLASRAIRRVDHRKLRGMRRWDRTILIERTSPLFPPMAGRWTFHPAPPAPSAPPLIQYRKSPASEAQRQLPRWVSRMKAISDGVILLSDLYPLKAATRRDGVVFIPHVNTGWSAGRGLRQICDDLS